MKMKSLKTQFIAAIAMVLVAAIAVGGSTYAWFVTNSTVKADGMKVQAATENGIEIKEATASSTWASAATGLHATGNALIPTSTVDSAEWYHASALSSGASDVDTTTLTTLSLTETVGVGKVSSTDEKGYYIHDQFKIRSRTATASNLVVSGITVSGTTDALSPGLRVLVKCGSNVHIYAPVEDATTSYTVNNTTAVTAFASATGSVSTDLLAASIGSTDAAAASVDVYVYFEGEDESIFTDHIPETLQNLSVTLNFSATI